MLGSASNSATTNTLLLEASGLTKSFGAVKALKGISFTINRGEVVALVGDNGAGKSTLVKVISGVERPTEGSFSLNGNRCEFFRPADAKAAGVETVYQHLALVENLDVSDNIYLGREIIREGWLGRTFGLLDRGRMRQETADVLDQLHINIPAPTHTVHSMSGGQRQAIAIGRAMNWGRELLILDEPTAALGVEETEQVLRMIEKLNVEKNITFLIVSHNMQDVYRIADKILVLRQGHHVATLIKGDTSPQEIVAYITGALP